jgi:hypothetical protein
MKLHTLTNEYVEVIMDGKLIKADLEYIGKNQVFTIGSECYMVNKLS